MAAFDARRIIVWSDDHKIVPSDLTAIDAVALADKFLLCLRVVHQHQISVAAPRGFESLAGALRDDTNLDAARLRKQRQNATEKPGVLDRCRRRKHDGRGCMGVPSQQ